MNYPKRGSYKMNIVKMLKMQDELDKAIFKKSNLKNYPAQEVRIAFKVELGELAQEWKQFKYWKSTKGEINKDKLIEEWADCFHFALSLYNNTDDCKAELDRIMYYAFHESVEKDIYFLFEILFEDCYIDSVIALGFKLGFTEQEMQDAYYNKNRKNWERITNNY